MTLKNSMSNAVIAVCVLFAAIGCERDTAGLQPYPCDPDPVVFLDVWRGMDYQAFLFSKLDALDIEDNDTYQGSAAFKISVPDPGSFAGGAWVSNTCRDFSGFNALVFWAKASEPTTFNDAGFANDNTGTSKFQAGWSGIPLTTDWQRYIIPIPLPEKLTVERGLFWYADATETNALTVWIDEVAFADVPSITNPRPVLRTQNLGTFVGATVDVQTQTTFNVNGTDQTIDHFPGYFTFSSTNDSVVTVIDGEIRVVGEGTATILGKLGDTPALGAVTLNAIAPPDVAAPAPTHAAGDVISLYSNAYDDVDVFTWFSFGTANLSDLKVQGNDVKAYTNLSFVGIQFKPPPPEPPPPGPTPQIDAGSMTHLHMDIWVPDAIVFRVKLVDFGSDGRFQGVGADSEDEVPFAASTTPPLVNGTWVQLDIPFNDPPGDELDKFDLQSREHLAQLILSIQGNENTVFIDNVYFYREPQRAPAGSH